MPNKRGRAPKSEHIKKTAFLAAYAGTGSIKGAARKAKVPVGSHYYWLKADPAYPEQFATVRQHAIDALESHLHELAFKGNVTAAIFLLKGLRPDVYGDRVNQKFEGTLHQTGQVNLYLPDNGRGALPVAAHPVGSNGHNGNGKPHERNGHSTP